jgi:hypothetical protein
MPQELASFRSSSAAQQMTAVEQQEAHQFLQEAMQGFSYGSPSSQAITLVHFAAVHAAQKHQQQQAGQVSKGTHLEAASGGPSRVQFPRTLEEVMQVDGVWQAGFCGYWSCCWLNIMRYGCSKHRRQGRCRLHNDGLC